MKGGPETQLAGVPAAADVLRGRFPRVAGLPVALVGALLAGAAAGDGSAAEAAALDLLHDDATMELLAEVCVERERSKHNS